MDYLIGKNLAKNFLTIPVTAAKDKVVGDKNTCEVVKAIDRFQKNGATEWLLIHEF